MAKLMKIVIITASICGYYALGGLPSYTASKQYFQFITFDVTLTLDSALIGFTRSYSRQMLEDHNIELYAICPNVVETNISTASFYSKIRDNDAKLLTPVATVVESAERMISGSEPPGAIHEQGPRGIFVRTNNDFAQVWDKETDQVCDLLEDRGLSFYKSKILQSKAAL
jgi:hypothetical protein